MSDKDKQMVATVLTRSANVFGSAPMSELSVLLCTLRAYSDLARAHHWQTRGAQFYGDHLMYERIYKEANKLVDSLAERAVGLGDHKLVDPVISAELVSTMVKMMSTASSSSEQYVMVSLKSAAMTLEMVALVRETLTRKSRLSNGTDNLLQGMADDLESHLYLLKQRAKTEKKS